MEKERAAQKKSGYDRLSVIYDIMERLMIPPRWRRRLLLEARGRVLEVGVGTGINLILYPDDCRVTGIDPSSRMLERARRRARKLDLKVGLREMDVENLTFPSGSFDTVVATFVFCSVTDPVRGLQELRRVCRRGGRILLLEHMRSQNHVLAFLQDIFNPITQRLMEDHINRPTLKNIREAGLKINRVDNLMGSVVQIIRASG